jgi:hypothetical protein
MPVPNAGTGKCKRLVSKDFIPLCSPQGVPDMATAGSAAVPKVLSFRAMQVGAVLNLAIQIEGEAKAILSDVQQISSSMASVAVIICEAGNSSDGRRKFSADGGDEVQPSNSRYGTNE